MFTAFFFFLLLFFFLSLLLSSFLPPSPPPPSLTSHFPSLIPLLLAVRLLFFSFMAGLVKKVNKCTYLSDVFF